MLAAEQAGADAARETLLLLEQKLSAQRQQTAADARANEAAAARLASEQGAIEAAEARAKAEEEKAQLAKTRELAEQAAAQAALDKRDAQRILLERAQQAADMQRKTLQATEEMADAKRRLIELESARQEEQVAELGLLRERIDAAQAEAKQRAESADLARELLGRFSQLPSAQQAAARLSDVVAKQRGEG